MKWIGVLAALMLAACHGASSRQSDSAHGLTSGAIAADADAPGPTSTSQTRTAGGAELPLQRGVYVSLNTACEAASAASVSVLGAHAIVRDGRTCEFTGVSRTATTTYTVMVHCTSSTPSDVGDDVETWELTSPTSFSRRGGSGWHEPTRLCPKAELPQPWRSAQPAE